MEHQDNALPRRGYVHVYTGNGKGKTTAALGLTLRAAGAGLRVFIGQFMKTPGTSEAIALARFADRVLVRQYGSGVFLRGKPSPEDVAAARSGLDEVRAVLAAGRFDVVVADEANVASHFGLVTAEDLVSLVDIRPPHVELIFTGRKADPRLLARADLVTEMREVRHYFAAGVPARRGIEE